MDKKSYIQISIFFGIVIIITFVYLNYFKKASVNNIENNKNNEKSKIVERSGDLIKKMSYFDCFKS